MKNPNPCLFFVLVITITLSSCSLSNDKNKPLDVIDSVSCTTPCWRGITPGVTTFDEAWAEAQRLTQANNIDSVVPLKIEKDDVNRSIYFDYKTVGVMLYADTGGIIKEIFFIFANQYRRENPKLAEILTAYGEPDTIDICLDSFEINRALVYLHYSNIEIFFGQRLPIEGDYFTIQIQKNTRIDDIKLLPQSYDRPVYDFSFSWTGYGDVIIEPAKKNVKSICRELFP